MDPQAAFLADAKRVMQNALAELHQGGVELSFDAPPNPDLGDVAVPCFPLARALRKAPAAIAAELAAAAVPDGWVVAIAAAGPYVNLTMDRARQAQWVLDNGMPVPAPKPGLVLVEHTSANPNGPLHVGRARNPILGDTLTRIWRAAGYNVESQYYMDNLGRQVALLYWGKTHIDPVTLEPALREKSDHDLVRYYQAANEAMENDAAIKSEIKTLVATLEEAPPELLVAVRAVYESCFAGMQESLNRLGVSYDSVKDESDLVADGNVQRVIDELKVSPRAAVEPDGANFLDLEAELKGNKSTKFFFTRKDQTSVYATRDVAYHQWKSDQVGPDGHLLDVLGEDHRLQSLQVGVALDELNAKRPEVVFYAFVSLPEGKMSTRANRVVFLDDLLDEAVERALAVVQERRPELSVEAQQEIAEDVGISAIRYNIVKVQPEKPIAFRWEEALDFDGDSAPYLMYAYARACSLLERAPAASDDYARPGLGEQALLGVIANFPAAIGEARQHNAPHRFCAYVTKLAGAFNEYYRDHPVIQCEDPAVQALRIRTVQAAVDALRVGLETLGLRARSSM